MINVRDRFYKHRSFVYKLCYFVFNFSLHLMLIREWYLNKFNFEFNYHLELAVFTFNQLFLAEAQLFLFLNSILTSFQPWTLCLKCFSSLRFPDQFASSMNIFQNNNFKISNLRLAVLIKVVLIKKKFNGGMKKVNIR